MKKYAGDGALLLTTLLWGVTFVVIKSSLENVSPLLFVSLRFSLAALIILPFIFGVIKISTRQAIIGGVILGLLNFAGFATQTIGLNFTSATKSGFITGTFVVFTPIFQFIIEKRIPRKENILGIFLVLLGLMLLSSKGTSVLDIFSELGGNFNIGDLFTLFCAISFALYIVYLDMVSHKFDYKLLVFVQITVTAILGWIFTFGLSVSGFESFRFSLNNQVIFAVIYTALFATVIATSLQTKFQKFVTPTKAAIIFSLEPIFAAFFAFVIIGERISYFGFIGGIFIFTGLLVSELMGKKEVSKDE
ncbi:MAG TPA: DMT family transporter [Ignavibacteriaceae bacterium]|nr:DMT family transporter [Ignavibacteriaceae bacterium]